LISQNVYLATPVFAVGHLLESLTPREHEVLDYWRAGHSNGEIASALTVSEATVKSHIGHMLMKLDVRDRVQAVIFAYESGLVAASRRPA
jgi:DNA-binding NarL/FixJ family response regulator